jgi:hypothetical protein
MQETNNSAVSQLKAWSATRSGLASEGQIRAGVRQNQVEAPWPQL